MQALVPVLAALVGALAGLAGAFGAPWIKARIDVDQWRRDKRLEAYVDLSRSVHVLAEAITARLDADAATAETTRQRVEQATFDLQRAAGRVELLGPASIRNTSIDLAEFVGKETRSLREKSYSPAEGETLATFGGALTTRYSAFIDAARADLGVP